MNRWQKIAWFNLIVIVAGLVISVVAAGTLPPDERLVPPNRITVVIVISLVLVGIAKTIFRKADKGADFDERDGQIHRRANLFGWTGFGLGMAATIMVWRVTPTLSANCCWVISPFSKRNLRT